MRTLQTFALLACAVLPLTSGSDDYRVSGPYTHENLSIFLIHGASSGKKYLTLSEGLASKKVVVYETKQVNELAIENLSGEDVFVQGGDIVKGGQQDRVLPTDFLLPAKSGRVPISSFCVEPGRWTRRGNEAAGVFSASTAMTVNADMAKAAKVKKNQSEVWNEVAKARTEMQAGAADAVTVAAGGVGSGSGGGFAATTSSYQLAVEAKPMTVAVDKYVKALSGIVDAKPDVVGFAFTVNGKVSGTDVYSSAELFRAMWPKLLKAGAVEAVRSIKKDQTFAPADATNVKTWLDDAKTGKTTANKLGKVTLVDGQADKVLTFESRDGEAMIHRNYIAK